MFSTHVQKSFLFTTLVHNHVKPTQIKIQTWEILGVTQAGLEHGLRCVGWMRAQVGLG